MYTTISENGDYSLGQEGMLLMLFLALLSGY